ncbi:hypothetical protein OEZ86_000519 [Tetradesmus obliquus]|nr:hypothetical protein OEZ86_000519 [Tetradesmus obliquus]
MVGRASAPGGASVLAAFDMHGPAPYRSNSSEGMAALQQQQQQQQRPGHHRRSCSYAGAGGGLYADAAMPGAAGLPDVSMHQFAGMARAGAAVGADMHALVMPTRIVTTGGSAAGLGTGAATSLQQQQQQQQRQHYMM